MRYFIHLAYHGQNYSGWQVQANAPSVQQTINEALQKLLREPIKSMGCGRTDAGVHAKDFYMHLDIEQTFDIPHLIFRLNALLPESIVIYNILPLHEKAHTRFDATERTYEYYVYFDKTPFLKNFAYYQGFYAVDWDKVVEATSFLKTIEDFSSLCLPSEDFKTNICHIKEAKWDVLPSHHSILKPLEEPMDVAPLMFPHTPTKGEVFRFTVTSNRFLRGMIRKIVGTTLMIGKGKLDLAEFKETVGEKRDFKLHYLAPPNGLFLSKIKYPYL
jgi:tRNA pseudouridine38-40 synthase